MNSETSLSELTAKLNKIEERRKLALLACNTGIWDWVIPTDTLIWDAGMLDIYGMTQEEFGGKYSSWESKLHPEDLELTNKAIQKCLEHPQRQYFYRFRIMRHGVQRIVSGFGNCIRDEFGKPVRMVGINILEPEVCDTHTINTVTGNLCEICPSRFAKIYESIGQTDLKSTGSVSNKSSIS